MFNHSKAILMASVATAMALAPVAAQPQYRNQNLGEPRGAARTSVNRGNANVVNNNRPNNNRPNNNRPGNRPGGNVNAGNTVIVGQPNRGNPNWNNNNNNNNWNNNNDNSFLEFVGRTAAVTAGISVVAAVIGSVVNDRPDGCQETVSNGQVFLNCNGTWYQPVTNNGQQQYQVIAPPQ